MSDKHANGQFRETFKGYHKDDVNAYIQQMFFQFEERERVLLRQIKELSAQTPQTMPASQSGYDAVMEQLAAKDREIDALKARVKEMEEAADRYERMSAQIGDIMLRARSDADRMTDQANESAQLIEQGAKARAEAFAASIRAEALKQADTIISYASDRMKHLYHEETEGYAKVLDTLQHQTVHFAEKLNEYRESFPQEIDDAQAIAKASIKQYAQNASASPLTDDTLA